MIKPLLIATKENEGILKKALTGIKHEPRVQSGSNWSLKRFVNTDLKNYMAQTHIILDVSAFQEFNQQGDEFIELLKELQEKHDKAVIIVYCDKLMAGNLFLHRLVKVGFTNIIARYDNVTEAEVCKLMQTDLTEAITSGLSEQKYNRFVLTEETVTSSDGREADKPDFSGESRTVTVFSSQRRIGATTFAMSLCKYVAGHKGKAALVLCCKDAAKEQEFMRKYFSAEEKEGYITINGVDVFIGENADGVDGYNLVVFDCGDVHQNADKLEVFGDVDMVFLCCGVGWKELHHTASTHGYLNGLGYTVVVDADEDACDVHKDVLCGNLNEVRAVRFKDSDMVGRLLSSCYKNT